MSRFTRFRLSRLLGRLPVWGAGLSFFVLSLVLGVLAPSPAALAHAHFPPTRTHIDSDVKSFQFLSASEVAVVGNDGKLWLEHAPFGIVPPGRTLLDSGGFDGAVGGFQMISDTEFLVEEVPAAFAGIINVFPNDLFLVRSGISLKIDEDVKGFQWLSDNEILVLGSDNKLWLEHAPFGNVPPGRFQVDANVVNFQAFSDSEIVVLGTDGKLWLERGPFGNVPPSRVQIDANVTTNLNSPALAARPFQALSDTQILVLGTDGKLWLEQAPFGHVPPSRVQVDGSALNFQAIDGNTVVVLGQNKNLWLEHAPFGHVPPTREQIDANAIAFQALSTTLVGVKGDDNNLWLEQAPFG
jgi:hypothetical protein